MFFLGFFCQGAVESKIEELADELDLVMVAEWMDESLVLLAHLLCLPLHTVAMPIHSNARKKTEKVNNHSTYVLI